MHDVSVNIVTELINSPEFLSRVNIYGWPLTNFFVTTTLDQNYAILTLLHYAIPHKLYPYTNITIHCISPITTILLY